jgi:DNA-binding LacI/PurR family transcriptional regulator
LFLAKSPAADEFIRMQTRRVTQADIAAKLGVSHATVALALKNHHRISTKRREEVQRMAKKMGYQPDPFLAGLAAYRRSIEPSKFHGVIAWVNHWAQPEGLHRLKEFEGYWLGAKEAAKQFGYQLEEVCWPADCPAKRFERILLARGILGVLIPPHRQSPNWGNFDWSKFSLVRFGMSVANPDSNVVTSDQFRATVMAIANICRLGYQKIGFVLNRELDEKIGGNYTGGFYAAQKLFGNKAANALLIVDVQEYELQSVRAEKQLHEWLKKTQPDAVLTTLPELPGMIRRLGYRIPQDFPVAGTSLADIPVDTGVDQRAQEIGRIAVEMLVKQININERGEPSAPCRILVESTWQDGKSLPHRRAR